MKAIIGVALLAVCAFGQTFENLPVKNTQLMGMTNPLWTTGLTGMKVAEGEWNHLSLQELIQHPLFVIYYNLPLFKQHFAHPLFRVYLTTPQFQNYWTLPLFPTFFTNQVLFYKYIYPQVFNTQIQTPMITPSWIHKTITPTTYDEVMRQIMGVDTLQKDNIGVQGLYWDKIMKNTYMNINKPEEVTEVKTEVKVPVTTHNIFNPIEKMMGEKLIEETPIEMMMKDKLVKDSIVKDTIVKDDLVKDMILKKFYWEKMMNKMSWNKMTPEELTLLQNKMQELIPTRVRRNANYVEVPSTNVDYTTYNKEAKALPFFYNYPANQGVYYTQPLTTFANNFGTPYQYTNTFGTPYQYTNTFGTPYQYTNTWNTPYVYPTQTVV